MGRIFGKIPKAILSHRAASLLIGALITVLCALLYIYRPLFLQFLDFKVYDTIVAEVPQKEPSNVPVIIDLDDAALNEFGQWPWPRYRVAMLMEKIRRLGALSVGLDIVFPEYDRSSPSILKQELMRDLQVNMEVSGIPQALLDNDQVFAGVLENGPFVLGYNFRFKGEVPPDETCVLHPLNPAFIREPEAPEEVVGPYKPIGVVCNIPVLSRAAASSGFFNTISDKDGLLRRTPLFVEYKNSIYPSLAVASLLQAVGRRQTIIKYTSGGVESLRIGKTVVPLDAQGNLLLRFRGKGRTFPYYSAADILNDKLPAGALEGKIAFIGTSASGLRDLRSTPLDPVYPGVEAHATIIDNILAKDFLYRPDWAPGLEITLVFFVGLISTLLLIFAGTAWGLAVFSVLGGTGIWFGVLRPAQVYGLMISPLFPLLTFGSVFGALTLLKLRSEESRRKFFHSAFSKYVSKAVVEQMVRSPEKLALSGEEKEVSILFSDIRSFTSMSEKLSPKQISDLLHMYFTPMTKMIIDTGGTLDKFIGDAIMAFWNAPLDVPNHQRCAVLSALGMMDELERLNPEFLKRFGLELNIGVGLHCGLVSVGNMGSADLFDYTILGDNVNLGSRVEGLTKYYGLKLLVSESIRDACPEGFLFQEVDRVRVVGKEKPITMYTPFRPEHADRYAEELAAYEQALSLYREHAFEQAREQFLHVYETFRPVKMYRVYAERCVQLAEEPPGPDWDFVFAHKSK